LEEGLDQPIGAYFDLIAGTSTGGILAIGLALGIPARQLLQLYVERGPYIFGQASHVPTFLAGVWGALRHVVAPKYDAGLLRRELEVVLGQKRIGDASTRLLVPAWDPSYRSVYIFKTAHHPRLKMDYARPAIDAAMATTAAPTYFKRHVTADQVGLLDGGVWANNPIALAVVEAIALLGWPATSLRVLSLGCVNEVYAIRSSLGWGTLARDVARLFMDGQSRGALGMAKLLTGHEYERDAIFRCCPDVPKDFFRLDDTSKITQLRGMGAAAARKERPRLEPVFFQHPAERFEPVYKIKEIAS
jgi:hypothetical protein